MSKSEIQSSVVLAGLMIFVIVSMLSAFLMNVSFQSLGLDTNFFALWGLVVAARFGYFSIVGK